MGDRLDDVVAIDRCERVRPQAVEAVEHRPDRPRHVVARVPVGNREHVQVVDLLLTLAKVVVGDADDAVKAVY